MFLLKIFHLDTEGKVPEHRITGQYRNKSNRIWDPHPQYLIDAFGLHLHLILYQDNNFIPKSLKVSHSSLVWQCDAFDLHSIELIIMIRSIHLRHRSHIFGIMRYNGKPMITKIMNNCVVVSIVDAFEPMIDQLSLYHFVMAW